MAGKYHVRTMLREELDFAVDLAAAEGWNPGLHDAGAFFAADPGGFLVGLLDDEPIGCISAVRYGNGFGFLGFYIVAESHRGRGYGLQLWNGALRQFGARNVGLDGVQAQQDNYRKSGFKLAYSNIRYAWEGPGPGAEAACFPNIVEIGSIGASTIARYDRLVFPADRQAFLDAWLKSPGAVALAWQEDRALRGYGVIRPCREGWKVGPLFADDEAIAASLLLALAKEARGGGPVFLDVPEPNAAAMRLAAGLGMQEVFGTARMYNRQTPDIALEKIFGVTTFELG
jgi:RimJ/RimL family protein N-acetyltransferase